MHQTLTTEVVAMKAEAANLMEGEGGVINGSTQAACKVDDLECQLEKPGANTCCCCRSSIKVSMCVSV